MFGNSFTGQVCTCSFGGVAAFGGFSLASKEESETLAGKFESPDEKSDITLIVEEKKLYVHKSILEYSSPVFGKMFSGNFKEGTASEIPLPDKYQAFVNFLHQIYPDSYRAPIQDDTLEDMLDLADKYQVEFLVKRCTNFLKKQATKGKSLTLKQTMMYLYLCHKYTHHLSLWDEFWKLAITKDYRAVKKNGHFQQLPDERRSELLELRCEFMESTLDSILTDIPRMLSHQFDRKPQIVDMLKDIRGAS